MEGDDGSVEMMKPRRFALVHTKATGRRFYSDVSKGRALDAIEDQGSSIENPESRIKHWWTRSERRPVSRGLKQKGPWFPIQAAEHRRPPNAGAQWSDGVAFALRGKAGRD